MGFILDEVRDAIKEKNSKQEAEEKKEALKISSSEEDKIREFESRLENMLEIMERLDESGADTEDLRRKMEEKLKKLTWSLR